MFSKSQGKMLEWLKRHAWKACKRQKRFRGSNPRLSAKILTKFARPSLHERANSVKSLHRMPVADCGDYGEIPVFPQTDYGEIPVFPPNTENK